LAVGVYLVTLLLLLPWGLLATPQEQPIPVQLVIEQPPPPPPAPLPPAPKKEEKAPIGPIASVDMGQTAGKPDAPEEKPAPPPEPERKTAAVEPPKPPPPEPPKEAAEPPKPQPPSKLTSALPKPTVPDAVAALPEPETPPLLDLTPPPAPRPKQPVVARVPLNQPLAPHPTEYPGPAATRNEYLAYCEAMIRRYSGMISDSFLAGRRGAATLTLLVLGNGTIARISVVQSSGYQDIDNRVEQMVAAVRRFPPLPQWFQGTTMPLMYHYAFPNRH
jgi:protein TonB